MIPHGVARYIITKTELEEFKKEIRNETLEEVALLIQPNPHVEEERNCEDVAKQIRSLKRVNDLSYKNKGLSGY